MIASPWVRLLVRKEFRALMPSWTGCALVIWTVGITHDRGLLMPALLAYGLGAVALGALSIGHEYSHRIATAFGTGLVFGLLLLRFAFVNHRSPERATRRVALQLTALAGFAVVCLVTMTVLAYYPASRLR